MLGYIKQISKLGQDYYPELLGTMFIVNSPMLFSSAWSLIKPLLDEATVKKIHILGSSYKKQLQEYVDMDALPERLGGTSTEPGETSNLGPWATVPAEKVAALRAETIARNTDTLAAIKQELNKTSGAADASTPTPTPTPTPAPAPAPASAPAPATPAAAAAAATNEVPATEASA